jgi:hypothetical protein
MEKIVVGGVLRVVVARVVSGTVWRVLHVVGAIVELVHLELHVLDLCYDVVELHNLAAELSLDILSCGVFLVDRQVGLNRGDECSGCVCRCSLLFMKIEGESVGWAIGGLNGGKDPGVNRRRVQTTIGDFGYCALSVRSIFIDDENKSSRAAAIELERR